MVPFAPKDVVPLVVAAAAPLLPLVLVVVPLEELIGRIVKIIM